MVGLLGVECEGVCVSRKMSYVRESRRVVKCSVYGIRT